MIRLYRTLARLLLPPSFFREYGVEMVRSVEARLERAGGARARGLVLAREVVDLLATARREWWSWVVEGLRGEAAGSDGDGARIPGSASHARRGDMMGTWMKDVQYAARTLARRPGFTAVAVLTLALGIGGTGAIFTVVDHVLIRAFPFEESHRLAFVWSTSSDAPGANRGWVSYPDYRDIRAEQSSFESMAAYRAPSVTLTSPDAEPASVSSASADMELTRVFRVSPILGRWFTAEEDRVGGPPVAVLGHALWSQRFGADPSILGTTVKLDGVEHEIVGVMPPDFAFPDGAQLYRPLAQDAGQDSRGMHRLIVPVRLADGTSLERANQDVLAITRRLEEEYRDTNGGTVAFAESLKEAYVVGARGPLLILMGAVALVLLIVCANVANLFLARTADRSREMALRSALGAGRGRIVRQLLTEACLLALAGGLLGLGLAHVALDGLLALAPATLPRASSIALDGRVVSVMMVASLGTTLLFGLVPAVRASRTDVREALAEGGRSGGLGRGRLRSALVVSEVALAMMLVVGAGLLIRSFASVQAQDPGFAPDDLYAVPLTVPQGRYPLDRWQAIADFFREAEGAVERIPGVRSAALAYAHPVQPGWGTSFWLAHAGPPPPPSERPDARYRPVGPGYFRTAGIPVVRGREITADDDASSPPVVVVNEAFARAYLPDQDPLGKKVLKETWWEGTPEGEWEIVGVVADVRFMGMEQASRPALYYPHAQRPMSDMIVMIRSELPLASLAPGIKEAVWSVDSQLPVETITSMEEALSGSRSARTFNTLLLTLFAATALVLAAVGIYGVISYTVTRRTHEMGVRMSLGAGRSQVLRLVLKQGLVLAAAGTVVGGVAALALNRVLSNLLFGVSGTDPVTYGVVGSVLLAAAAVAALLPALRATRVDPVTALRVE